jgi:type II secretory pathway pseudopilin PulG
MLITAVVLIVLVGIAALAIDLSIAMAERRDAQNAADHAALSAAWAHCNSGIPATAADNSVLANGYATSQLTLTNPETGVYEAAIASTSGVFFAKIWTSSDIAIGTSSAAECQVTSGSGYAIQTFGDCGTDWGITFNGNDNTIIGGVHTDYTFTVPGERNTFDGPVTYGEAPLGPVHNTNTFLQGPPTFDDSNPGDPYLLLFNYNTYQGLAPPNSTGKIESGDIPGDGVYWTSGEIILKDLGTAAVPLRLTLVAGGKITLGENLYIEPFIDNLLAFSNWNASNPCSDIGITINSQPNDMSGIVYARHSGIEWSGDTPKELDPGSLVGWRVVLNGNFTKIVGLEAGAGGPAEVDLTK